MHQSVDIYIQHTLTQPDYCDGFIDNVDEGSDNIIDEVEELFNKLHDDIVDKLNDGNAGVEEGNVKLNDDNV